jgi:hypothetical protein
LRDLNSIVIFSVGFPFPFKNNKNGSLFLFYKIESWKGKKQRNAKKQRKIGALRWLPSQTSWPAGRGLPALVKFLCGPHNSTKHVVIRGLAVMVSKLW